MSPEREKILQENRRLKEQYGQLFDDLQALFFRHDPMGINFGYNVDEYAPEVANNSATTWRVSYPRRSLQSNS
jgi:hypothetical protein